MSERLIRGPLLHCLAEPDCQHGAVEYIADALLWLKHGRVHQLINFAEADALLTPAQRSSVEDQRDYLMVPGFVDCHIHYPQTEMIAAYGTQLLEWLNTFTFPVESSFDDVEKAATVAKVFIDQLLTNGTTTALVFCSVHPESADALFSEAQQHQMRLIAGKVMMDRNAPESVLDTAQTSYDQSKQLIERWHGVDRLQYAVTPRFAPTSTDEQLHAAGRLLAEHEGVYLHTHLSENVDEIEWVKQLFPNAKNYLDVYDQAGLLGKRSVFAHGIHLCDGECERLAQTDSAIAHCPTSNMFIGSGLFPMQRLQAHGIKIGMGTDVGGGTSFSMLQPLADGYKMQQLNGHNLSPEQSFYLATLGGAKALDMDDKIGNFTVGKEADFLLLDPNATPLLKFRNQHCQTWRDTLFVLQTLGDDRVIAQTNVMGQPVSFAAL
ncbi:MAG: guanine deaminase [Oceanospirillaceae bacterium]|nr:guanine deaminase [Oceanospirillaceae bacterium]